MTERERHPGRALLGLLLVLLVLAVGCWYYVDLGVHRVSAIGDYPGRPGPTAGTNWLIVGSADRGALSPADRATLGLSGPGDGRTDTVLLLNIPVTADPPTVVSLLRDSWLPIPGHGTGRLDSAYALGGPALLVRTVEQATGLHVDHYLQTGYAGLANVVDDVGGVRACSAGCPKLTGVQAVGYLRALTPGGDPGRVARQRAFLGMLLAKITGPGVYLDPFRLVPLLVDLPDALTVDQAARPDDLLALSRALGGVGTSADTDVTVPVSPDPGPGGAVVWDVNRCALLFSALRSGTPAP